MQGSKLEKGYGSFRFWTDARRFKGSEDKCIVQQALYEAGAISCLSQQQHAMCTVLMLLAMPHSYVCRTFARIG